MVNTQRRKRGFILTEQGLKKLLEAREEAEYTENSGYRYTLETMSERTKLSKDTLMKLFACEAKVDKQTLKDCFRAFNINLEAGDYYQPDSVLFSIPPLEPEFPEGAVPLHSSFYVERGTIEADCYKAITQPGSLIRIKSPRRTGKSSLMTRILHYAAEQDYRTVSLSLRLADNNLFQSLDKFLQWFCANVSQGIQLPNRLRDYWDDLFGCNMSCKIYFEQYLLSQTEQPVVIAIDDIDRLFQYPTLADDFFGLLRAWHEEAKNRPLWQKLRLIVAHSSEVYIPLNTNQSPFNVGLPVELTELSPEQVQDLAERYQLEWSTEQVEQLRDFVGGNPYLIRLALYHIWNQTVTLEQILTETNIYKDHLQGQLYNLQYSNSGLKEAYCQLIMANAPIEIDLVEAFKLQSLGLIRLQGNFAIPSCQLYYKYFNQEFFLKNKNQNLTAFMKLHSLPSISDDLADKIGALQLIGNRE